jgi:hypothetical protein
MAFYGISREGLHLSGTAKTNLTASVATRFGRPGKVTGLVICNPHQGGYHRKNRNFLSFLGS